MIVARMRTPKMADVKLVKRMSSFQLVVPFHVPFPPSISHSRTVQFQHSVELSLGHSVSYCCWLPFSNLFGDGKKEEKVNKQPCSSEDHILLMSYSRAPQKVILNLCSKYSPARGICNRIFWDSVAK